MYQSDPLVLTPIDVIHLEQQVEALIGVCNRMRAENRSLRQRQEMLLTEKAALIEKTELARSRVEAMITRLKAMEHGL